MSLFENPEITDKPMPKILFCMAHPGFVRNFARTIVYLSRSADVHVHFSKRHDTIEWSDHQIRSDGPGNISHSFRKERKAQEPGDATALRLLRNALFYAQPAMREASDLQQRYLSLQKASPDLQAVLHVLQQITLELSSRDRLRVAALLERHDRAIAPSQDSLALMETLQPDLVALTPLINFGARETDILKAAQQFGIPTCLPVASWDNLTNKGTMNIKPDRLYVWNRHMQDEAISLHGVPSQDVKIVGASIFDQWFDRQPTMDREQFCRSIGMDPDHRIVLYACSSESIAGPAEIYTVIRWIKSVTGSRERHVRKANLLVRPHPMNLSQWNVDGELLSLAERKDVGRLRGSFVWPIHPKHPTDPETEATFFDALFHADAVVGLNTSVMVEAAILKKPVFTFSGHDAVESQTANKHFRYLAQSGFVRHATGLAEHVGQIEQSFANPGALDSACQAFVDDFIRPKGRTKNASKLLARAMLAQISKA